MVTGDKAVFDLHIPRNDFLAGKHEFWESISLCWFLYQSKNKVTADALREAFGLLMSCCAVSLAGIGVVEVPMRTNVKTKLSYLSVKDLIHCSFLLRWPLADIHFNVTFMCLLGFF